MDCPKTACFLNRVQHSVSDLNIRSHWCKRTLRSHLQKIKYRLLSTSHLSSHTCGHKTRALKRTRGMPWWVRPTSSYPQYPFSNNKRFKDNMQARHLYFLCSPPASIIIVVGMLGSTSLLIPFTISLRTCSPFNHLVSIPVGWPICFQNLCWQQIPQVHCICYIKKVFPFISSKPISYRFQWVPLVLVLQDLENNLHSLYPLPWFYKSWSYPLSPNWSSCCA